MVRFYPVGAQTAKTISKVILAVNFKNHLFKNCEKKTIEGSGDDMASVSPDLAKGTVDSVQAAVEMGDVIQVQSMKNQISVLLTCKFFNFY